LKLFVQLHNENEPISNLSVVSQETNLLCLSRLGTWVLGWDFAQLMQFNAIFAQKTLPNQSNLSDLRLDYTNPIQRPQCQDSSIPHNSYHVEATKLMT
jgi:hypothetical protein